MTRSSPRRGPFLLDTGVVVALLNSADPDHARCAAMWAELSGPFVTTEGVLTETAHLLRRQPQGFSRAWGLVAAVGTVVVAPTPYRYESAARLMEKYSDVPMDLVDGLLVALAEEASIGTVLTLDARGFDTYRTTGGKRLKRLP